MTGLDLSRAPSLQPLWRPSMGLSPDELLAMASGYRPGPVQHRRAASGGAPTMPATPAWILDHWDPSTQTTTGGGAPANGNPSSSIADTRSGSGRSWTASASQRPTFVSSAFSGRGGLTYDGSSNRMAGATNAPPAGACSYVHTWYLAAAVAAGTAGVIMGEANSSIGTFTFLTNLSAYRPIAFAATPTNCDPVGLSVTLAAGVYTLAWAWIGSSSSDAANPAKYRAVLNGVDVTASIVAGNGGNVGGGTANNCLGAYNTSGVSSFGGSMYKSRRWDRALTVAELIQASTEAAY